MALSLNLPTALRGFNGSNNMTNDKVEGDITFFDWQNDGVSDHVGIVEKIENGTIYTIEGNSTNDECRQNTYQIGSIYIAGYGTIRK